MTGRGSLVCFEGIDGSGKTTIARELVLSLRTKGVDAVLLTRATAPTDDFLARRLASLSDLLWQYPAQAPIGALGDRHLILLMASWFHLFDHCVIRPHLQAHQTTVMDMWCYKYIARFALKGFFTVSHLFDDLTEPNSIILLQVDPTVAAKRKHVIKATEKGFLSSPTVPAFVEYQRKVANILGSLVTDRWTCVDSSGRPSEIVDSIENSILSLKELPRFDQSS